MTRVRPPILAVAAILSAASGCGGETGSLSRGAASVRDSAGITIVDLGPVDYDALPMLRLAETPLLDIGKADGEEGYLLAVVRWGTRLPDGSIAVIDHDRIRTYEADGTHRWTQGGRGHGPGGYARPAGIVRVRGDTLVVWDIQLRRFTVLDPGGRVARVIDPDSVAIAEMLGAPTPGQLLFVNHGDANGAIDVEIPEEQWTRVHRSVDFWLVDLDGDAAGFMGRYRFTEFFREASGYTGEPPWTGALRWVGARGGVWLGPNRDYEVYLFRDTVSTGRTEVAHSGGTPSRIVRWQGPDQTVTPQMISAHEAEKEEDIARGDEEPDRSLRDLHKRIVEFNYSLPIPETFPAYRELKTDQTGRLWVRDYTPSHREPPETWNWTVLSVDRARVVGRFEQERDVTILDIGEDWMLVSRNDELGVEHVLLFEIVAGQSRPS